VHYRGEDRQHSNYLHFRSDGFDVSTDTSDEAATSNRDIDCLDSFNLFQDLFPDSSLTGNYGGVIIGRNEYLALLLRYVTCIDFCLTAVTVHLFDLRASVADLR